MTQVQMEDRHQPVPVDAAPSGSGVRRGRISRRLGQLSGRYGKIHHSCNDSPARQCRKACGGWQSAQDSTCRPPVRSVPAHAAVVAVTVSGVGHLGMLLSKTAITAHRELSQSQHRRRTSTSNERLARSA